MWMDRCATSRIAACCALIKKNAMTTSEKTKPIVICGFPGVGKTWMFKKAKTLGRHVVDSDAMTLFNKSKFPENYLTYVRDAAKAGNIVLCSTHEGVLKGLLEAGIPHVIAMPKHHEQMDEYLQRYIDRGEPASFVNHMRECWAPEYIRMIWHLAGNDKSLVRLCELDHGQYLSDVIKDLLE
jgi:hypothetical protein